MTHRAFLFLLLTWCLLVPRGDCADFDPEAIRSLVESLDRIQSSTEDLESVNAVLIREAERVRSDLDRTDQELNDLRDQITDLEKETNQLRDRLDQLAEKPKQAEGWWSFTSLNNPSVPNFDDPWIRTPIDSFLLAKQKELGLTHSSEADRRVLIRRLTYDLHGLPPTPEEVESFVSDTAPNAYEKLVDCLLASPRYGERWGRHWLDVARYADSNGLDENIAFEFIYKYRDWVIQSINEDLPYNQFVEHQIAGDLIDRTETESAEDYIHRVKAVGFLSVGPKMVADDDPVKKKLDIVDEQLITLSQGFMALTIGCARCHDHKF
ncbi:MAG: DUF1549 domain-containing protein, partial [Candidatus Omnitrophica bacterium]|nr:DUF1549 domain-containing protein [Candidatus Omnitrophota bacterium]